jgi:hypothetical protein
VTRRGLLGELGELHGDHRRRGAGNANVKALVYIAAFAPEAGEPIGAFGEKYSSELGPALRPRRFRCLAPSQPGKGGRQMQ